MRSELNEAVEVLLPYPAHAPVQGVPEAPVLLTCEHASEHLPDTWQWPTADRWLIGTHWAYDPGADWLTRELAEELGAVAVLSRFSRLLVDPNRAEDSPDLIRTRAEGRDIKLNRHVDVAERERRIERLHRPYHAAIDREVARSKVPLLLAMHTFTPVYEGRRREVEVGVLFDTEEALAERFRHAIADVGLVTRMNEPYSGREGLMYSVDRHARAYGRRALELEVRQDLVGDEAVRRRLRQALVSVLRS
jgi:predicted N-formylglutamate amidohydrolase